MKKSKIKQLTRSDKIRHTKMFHEAVDPFVEHLTQPEWDEVFEDEMAKYGNSKSYHVEPRETDVVELFKRYFEDSTPVRIKCRKGMIQIERISK